VLSNTYQLRYSLWTYLVTHRSGLRDPPYSSQRLNDLYDLCAIAHVSTISQFLPPPPGEELIGADFEDAYCSRKSARTWPHGALAFHKNAES
jgi:hypothetical protein